MVQIKELIQYLFKSVNFIVIIQPFEQGLRIRFGKHKKLLNKGTYFRLPYFDSIYVQESRLRVNSMPVQTLTTKDSKTITISSSLGYSIKDISKLYDTLYHPETTIQNMCMGYLNEYVSELNCNDIVLKDLKKSVKEKMKELDYGLDINYFEINTFAIVRTYRLIQDQNWIDEGLEMNTSK